MDKLLEQFSKIIDCLDLPLNYTAGDGTALSDDYTAYGGQEFFMDLLMAGDLVRV